MKPYCKRILVLFLVLGVLLGTLGAFPARSNALTEYDLWVGGVRVTSDNQGQIEGPNIAGSISFDPGTGTLELRDAFVQGHPGLHHNAGIYAGPNMPHLIINPIGDNYVLSGDDQKGILPAIYVEKNLTIHGSGLLQAFGFYADNKPVGRSSYGICAKNGRLTIVDGSVDLWADWTPGANSYGAYAREIVISGGTVRATALAGRYVQKEKKIVTEEDGSQDTIWVKKVFISRGVGLYGAITITGGYITASGGRFAIGRTPVMKGVQAQGSYRTDGAYTRTFVPCDYEQYKYFCTSGPSGKAAAVAAPDIPRTGDATPLTLMCCIIALTGTALCVRHGLRKRRAD